ncbi:MAG: SpoIIE family protein phosphatase [Thermoflexales bacterium]|nr:SpoIIE family protein phosphatase [Thermoflexales bacterium]
MNLFTGFLALAGLVALLVLGLILLRRRESRLALVSRVRELESLVEIGRALSVAELEVDALCELILDQASRIVDTSTFQIGLFEGEAYHIKLWQVENKRQPPEIFDLSEGVGIVVWVRRTGQSLLVHDFEREADTLPARPRYISLSAPRSAVFVPLLCAARADSGPFGLPERAEKAPISARHSMASSDVIGVVAIQSYVPDAFSEAHTRLLSIIANQAALAISNARLYEAEREQAWMSTALLQVAEATTRASSLDEILTTVVRLTPMLSGVDRCGILLWDAERSAFYGAHAYGLPRPQKNVFENWQVQPGDWWALGEMQDTHAPTLVDESEPQLEAAFGAVVTLMVPLVTRRQPSLSGVAQDGCLAGIMLVGARTDDTFNVRAGDNAIHRAQMIAGIANQATLAIETSQLAAAQREEAWVNTALLQVAEAVGSQVELSQVLTTIVRLTPLLVGVETCLIFLWDGQASVYTPGAAYGLSRGELATFHALRIPGEEWPLDLADTASSLPPSLIDVLPLRSPLTMPLRSKGSVVGVMLVTGTPPSLAQAGRPANILLGIAHQAAIAIENVNLIRQLAAREGLEREIRLARTIQTSFLPSSCPEVPGWDVAAFWQAARQVGGDFYDFIPRPRDHYALVIADVADKGVPAALFMALCRTLVRAATLGRDRLPGEALARANAMILSDARHSDLFVTMVMANLSPVGRVTLANAGHNPPMVVRCNNNSAGAPAEEEGGHEHVEYLTKHGVAMGVIENIRLENHTIRLHAGDVLLLYTDGLPDALNSQGEEFGMDRLEACVMASIDQPVSAIVQAIHQALTAFVGGEPPFDDQTMVVAKRLV